MLRMLRNNREKCTWHLADGHTLRWRRPGTARTEKSYAALKQTRAEQRGQQQAEPPTPGRARMAVVD
eukprot:6009435-Pleurochrysis_carterae.AAC.2